MYEFLKKIFGISSPKNNETKTVTQYRVSVLHGDMEFTIAVGESYCKNALFISCDKAYEASLKTLAQLPEFIRLEEAVAILAGEAEIFLQIPAKSAVSVCGLTFVNTHTYSVDAQFFLIV